MTTVNVSHKIRNPRDLSKWLNIWTAEVDGGNDRTLYKIIPSENWKIPVNRLDSETNGNLPSNISVSTDQIVNSNTAHNVTTPVANSYSQNALTKFNASGNLVAGPILNTSSNGTALLNEKGEWVSNKISLTQRTISSISYPVIDLDLYNNNNNVINNSKSSVYFKNSDTVSFAIEQSNNLSYLTADLKDSAVSTSKLAQGSVTTEKLSSNISIDINNINGNVIQGGGSATHLAIFDNSNDTKHIGNGPAINSSTGEVNKFLNEKGNWANPADPSYISVYKNALYSTDISNNVYEGVNTSFYLTGKDTSQSTLDNFKIFGNNHIRVATAPAASEISEGDVIQEGIYLSLNPNLYQITKTSAEISYTSATETLAFSSADYLSNVSLVLTNAAP